MKCLKCNAWASVLRTDARSKYVYRRYECANLHRFSTREYLVDVTSRADTRKPPSVAPTSAQTNQRKTTRG